jgi:uncharacterized protein
MRQVVLWMADNLTLTVSLFLAAAFVLLNFLAYRHARAMTHFRPPVCSTGPGGPEPGGWPGGPGPLSLFAKVRLVVNGVAVERPAEEVRPDRLDLPHEIHTFPGGAGKLEGWYIPRAEAAGLVVLFHGYAACKARLLPEARAFHELGYACFLVDFRGSGGSDGDATSVGYHEAGDVCQAAEYARRRWPGRPLIVFAQSMGAAATLRALARHRLRADRVILECPFDRLLSTVRARFATRGLPAFPAAQLLVFWGGLQHCYNGFGHNPVEYARAVTCPVLLLHGTADVRVSCAQARSIHANLGGAKQLHFFEDLGHDSFVAQRPDEWKEHVGRFLRGRVLVG